jgi:uncharacterized protein YeaO (DUF488 family)
MLKIKRAYEKESASDGKRIYVDRLWARGLSKNDFKFDEWLKELAPSPELRKWYGHEPGKFDEFRNRYIIELSSGDKQAQLKRLAETAGKTDVTLIYSARDTTRNNAVVLSDLIEKLMREKPGAVFQQ